MLSADNDDGTAANVWRAYRHSRLPRSWGMHWNGVPWYIGVPRKIRPATTTDVREGRNWLHRLLDLLPDLRVLLTLGNQARDAVTPLASIKKDRGIAVISGPHPSQRLYNSTKGAARDKVHQVFTHAVDPCRATNPFDRKADMLERVLCNQPRTSGGASGRSCSVV